MGPIHFYLCYPLCFLKYLENDWESKAHGRGEERDPAQLENFSEGRVGSGLRVGKTFLDAAGGAEMKTVHLKFRCLLGNCFPWTLQSPRWLPHRRTHSGLRADVHVMGTATHSVVRTYTPTGGGLTAGVSEPPPTVSAHRPSAVTCGSSSELSTTARRELSLPETGLQLHFPRIVSVRPKTLLTQRSLFKIIIIYF